MGTSLQNALGTFLGWDDDCPLPFVEVPPVNTSEQPPVLVVQNSSEAVRKHLVGQGYVRQRRFAILPSAHQPRWLLPQTSDRRGIDGFQLYVPYSQVARLVKALVVQMRTSGWHGWVRHSALVASKEPLPIEALVKELTGEDNPLFTLSLGSQCAYQKLTVQIMRPDGSILGYMKMPMTLKANQRLRHEATIVQKLGQFAALAPRIPRIFFAGLWNGRYIVFQSELKGKTGPAEYSELHGEFLRILQTCEQSSRPGPSLVLEVGEKWDMAASHLSSQSLSLGKRALSIASRELDATMVACSIHHGDFTPWNSRLSEGSLGLFDWESAAWSQPILWDQFHFLAQTESLLSKKYPAAIDVRKSNRSLYLLYLLHSTASFAAENAKPAVIEYRQKQMLKNLESLS